MPAFKLIPDAMIAAYAPVTARLMRRQRNNTEAIGILEIMNMATQAVSDGTVSFPVHLPKYAIGPNGCRVRLFTTRTMTGTPPPVLTGEWKLTMDGNTGPLNTSESSGDDDLTVDLPNTTTGDTTYDLDLTATETSGGGDHSAAASWPKHTFVLLQPLL